MVFTLADLGHRFSILELKASFKHYLYFCILCLFFKKRNHFVNETAKIKLIQALQGHVVC